MAVTKKKVAFGTSAGIAAVVAVILGGVYHDEGGYVNDPRDRGGETNLGVTKAVARESGYTGPMKAFPKQCDEDTPVCGDKIYFENYMEKPGYVPIIKADAAVGEELVNSAVNFGPHYPSTWLQASINELCVGSKLKVDGKIGPGTQAQFVQCQTNIGKAAFCLAMLDKLDGKQRARYDWIVRKNPSQKVFYKGWINKRIGNVDRKKCVA